MADKRNRLDVQGTSVSGAVQYALRMEVVKCEPTDAVIVPLTHFTFERDDRFAAPSTPEADEAWGSMMPDGDGFITVHDSKQYGLPPGKQTAQGELYDISLFHQLHCLKHLRTYAFTLKATVGRNNSQEIFDKLLAKGEDHVYVSAVESTSDATTDMGPGITASTTSDKLLCALAT